MLSTVVKVNVESWTVNCDGCFQRTVWLKISPFNFFLSLSMKPFSHVTSFERCRHVLRPQQQSFFTAATLCNVLARKEQVQLTTLTISPFPLDVPVSHDSEPG